ncbi:MAG: hypothetical protein JKY13_00790, partial [Gammaproteobacteria bacterium]|nr:hypothetical protein [Gammaproteobacteria bacterium]
MLDTYPHPERYLDIYVAGGNDFLPVYVEAIDIVGEGYRIIVYGLSEMRDVDWQCQLGQGMGLRIGVASGDCHYLHGCLFQYCRVGHARGSKNLYRVELRSWFGCLTVTQQVRSFVNRSVWNIINDVFCAYPAGYHRVTAKTQWKTSIPYCVQYQESDYAFVRRLLLSRGIHYSHRHSDTQHTLLISDSGVAFDEYSQGLRVGYPEHSELGQLTAWRSNQCSSPNRQYSQRYQMTHPHQPLHTAHRARPSSHPSNHVALTQYQQRHLPAHLDKDDFARASQNYLIQHSTTEYYQACSQLMGLYSGMRIHVAQHSQAEKKGGYTLQQLTHQAWDLSNTAGNAAELREQVCQAVVHLPWLVALLQTDSSHHYHNTLRFVASGASILPVFAHKATIQTQASLDGSLLDGNKVRSPISTIAPLHFPSLAGCQTARVVAPTNHRVDSDALGALTLNFPWDKNQYAVRCPLLQSWSGQRYGHYNIPRAGQDVLVSFKDGNPDCPVVLGSVSHRDSQPGLTPDQTPQRQGLTSECGHQLSIDDSQDGGSINLISSHDLSTHIIGDSQHHYGGHYQQQIQQGHYQQVVNRDYHYRSSTQITLRCGHSQLQITPQKITLQSLTIRCSSSIAAALSSPSFPHVTLDVPNTTAKQAAQVAVDNLPLSSKRAAEKLRLQLIHLAPRWRCVTDVANISLDDTATLLRCPDELQSALITDLLIYYTPTDPEQSVKIPLPQNSDYAHWPKLMKAHASASQSSGDVTSFSVKTWQKRIEKALTLSKPPLLSAGWLYVFCQGKGSPLSYFQQRHLFAEYRVGQTGEHNAASNTFQAVEFTHYAGADERPATGALQSNIAVPYQVVKATHSQTNPQPQGKPFKVWVFFSCIQLSWPRLHRLGGLATDDVRVEHLPKKQKKLLHQLASHAVDDTFFSQRVGEDLPAEQLKVTYRVQYQQSVAKPLDTQHSANENQWQKHSIYFIDTKQHAPYLLLNDPLGMVQQGNGLILNLFKHLRKVMNDLPNKQDSLGHNFYRAAVAALQLFYCFDHPGIIKANGEYRNAKTNQPLPWVNSQDLMDKSVLAWYLSDHQRQFLHGLIHAIQTCTSHLLFPQWHDKTHTVESFISQGVWSVDPLACIQDAFAQPKKMFYQGYVLLHGLMTPSCWDSHTLDKTLTVDNRFISETTYHQSGAGKLGEVAHSDIQQTVRYLPLQPYTVMHIVTTHTNQQDPASYQGQIQQTRDAIKHVILLARPAGFVLIDALHNPNFPLHHSFFPRGKHTTHDSVYDEQTYLKAIGNFQAEGFQAAWQSNSTIKANPKPSVEPLIEQDHQLFQALLANYMLLAEHARDKALQATKVEAKAIAKQLQHTQSSYEQLYRCVYHEKIDVVIQDMKQVTNMHLQIEHSTVLTLKLKQAEQQTALLEQRHRLQQALSHLSQGMQVISLLFALHNIREDFIAMIQAKEQEQSTWTLMANVTSELMQMGGALKNIQVATANLLQHDGWIGR